MDCEVVIVDRLIVIYVSLQNQFRQWKLCHRHSSHSWYSFYFRYRYS